MTVLHISVTRTRSMIGLACLLAVFSFIVAVGIAAYMRWEDNQVAVPHEIVKYYSNQKVSLDRMPTAVRRCPGCKMA